MARRYFGTDGIRGLANGEKLTPELAMRVGMAAGLKFVNGDHRNRVVIGKDTRRSGYMIESALTAGFTAVGMDVYLLGPMPTPAVAMLTRSLRADLGVMISASHNPFEDNGIKLFRNDGYKLSDALEDDIEQLMDSNMLASLSTGRDIGRAHRDEAAQTRYIEYAKRTMPKSIDLSGLRVVLDCANGAAYKVAPTALWELGAQVFTIGAVIAESWHSRGELRGGGLVATVMSNLGLERYLGGIGLSLERTQVGDRYVLEQMRARGFNVGGEQSGHIILTDFTTTGDDLIAALQLLAVAKLAGRPVSTVCKRFDKVPQLLQSVRYKEGKPLEHKLVQQAIKESEARLNGNGRLVIRASGTEPVIRVMAESDDESLVAAVVNEISATIKKVA
ncbi:MAG: phosphoglucosamine mutase [Devosia sp.]|nr:phosphoglucosamine mutase [Devosia sp.]